MRGLVLLVLMISVTMSQHVFASSALIQFNKSTILPADVQVSIEKQYQQNCEYMWSQGWKAEELRSEMRLEPMDQIPYYVIYTSYFTVRAYDLDGMHPFTFSMEMETVVEKPYSKSGRTVSVTKLDAGSSCSL